MTIEQAAKRLLIKSPFYGLFLLSLKRRFAVPSDKCKTAYVHVSGLNYEMVINQGFWDSLETDDCRLNLMLHELMHICLKHLEFPDRFPDKKKANIAEDLEVSNYVEYISKGGYYIWNYPNLQKRAGAKYYYDNLPEPLEQSNFGNQSGNQSGNNQSDDSEDSDPIQQNGGTIDDHSVWEEVNNLSEAEQQLLANQLNHILKQTAEQVQKMQGTIPGELTEIISELFKQKPAIFNWKAYFRRVIGNLITSELILTRMRPSRRFPDSRGVKMKRKPSVLVGIDTSGSVSNDELLDFFSEIYHLWKSGTKVTIAEIDTKINRIYQYNGKFDGKVTGRGGTIMDELFIHYKEHKGDYSSLILFTDGYFNINTYNARGVVWVLTSNHMQQEYPGIIIEIPKDNK